MLLGVRSVVKAMVAGKPCRAVCNHSGLAAELGSAATGCNQHQHQRQQHSGARYQKPHHPSPKNNNVEPALPPTALLFAGQGAQTVGMTADLLQPSSTASPCDEKEEGAAAAAATVAATIVRAAALF